MLADASRLSATISRANSHIVEYFLGMYFQNFHSSMLDDVIDVFSWLNLDSGPKKNAGKLNGWICPLGAPLAFRTNKRTQSSTPSQLTFYGKRVMGEKQVMFAARRVYEGNKIIKTRNAIRLSLATPLKHEMLIDCSVFCLFLLYPWWLG